MPFKSEAQRKKFYAMEDRGEISKNTVQEWERETKKQKKKLPEEVPKKKGEKDSCAGGLKLASNPRALGFVEAFLNQALGGE